MAKFYFQASDSTQKALAESIRQRREQEPDVVNNLAQVADSGSFQNALATEQPGLMSAQATMAPTQTTTPRPYETAGGDDYVAEAPTSQSVIDALAQPRRGEPKPNVGQRANLWRTQEGRLSLNSEGTKSSSALDPLGREVLVTTPSSSEVTGPTMHLTKDQVADLDRLPGYADELMKLFPNHTATELQETRQGEAGDLALIGKVPWEMFEVAQGLVLDPLAQTAAELLPGTEGGSWDPREGFGLTIANEGLFATTDKFRDRPWWQELIYGVAFDPTIVLGGLGLIKLAKKGVPLTYDVVSTAVRRYMMEGGEEVNEASVDAAAKHIIKENQRAGAGSAQPEGGWTPRKADGSEYSPQEILQAGGMDIADDAPMPLRNSAEAYDAGMAKIRAESEARSVINEGEPGPLSASVLRVMRNVEDDPDMRGRILNQLIDEGADDAAKQQRWDAFLRTTVHVLNEARQSEGGSAYVGLYAPGEFGGVAAQMRIGAGEMPTGNLTVPPTMRPAGELPMATRSITGTASRTRATSATDDLTHEAELNAKLYGDPRDGPVAPSLLQRTRNAYEQGQALFIDKFAAGNAASSRAQREFLKVINNFVEEDMARINAVTREKWRALGVPDNDIRVRRELVNHRTPGFTRVRRMPAEFNFEYQAALGAGMPGAARRKTGSTIADITDIVKRSTSDKGHKLRINRIEQFLTLRHAVDVIRIREMKALEKIRATGGELPEITQNGMNLQQIQEELDKLRNFASTHTITSTENGIKTISTQWDAMQEAAGRVTQHYRDLLKLQVDEGMVKAEVGDALQRNYPYYNPIKYLETQMLRVRNAVGEEAMLPGVSRGQLGRLADEGLDQDVVAP